MGYDAAAAGQGHGEKFPFPGRPVSSGLDDGPRFEIFEFLEISSQGAENLACLRSQARGIPQLG